MDAPKVYQICDLTLNIPMDRESVEDLKTFDNISEKEIYIDL